MRGSMRALSAEVIRESRQGRFPSDHYFVSATVAAGTSESSGEHPAGGGVRQAAPPTRGLRGIS